MLAMAINDDIACNTQLLSKVHISNPVSLILAYFNNNYEKRKNKHTSIDYNVCVRVQSSFIAIFINYILPVPISISIIVWAVCCIGVEQKKGHREVAIELKWE